MELHICYCHRIFAGVDGNQDAQVAKLATKILAWSDKINTKQRSKNLDVITARHRQIAPLTTHGYHTFKNIMLWAPKALAQSCT
jgi:hypothetical protein